MGFGIGTGVVDSFDSEQGLGWIVDDRGRRWLFHCTAIFDGTRTIEPGASVRFELRAGGPGRLEAFSVMS